MSEDIKIHHESMIGTHFEGSTSRTSVSWLKVTCGECKLERPIEKPAEYRTKDTPDGGAQLLADLKVFHAARRLRAVRASEEFALQTAEYWARVWRDAASLRVRLEAEAGVGQDGITKDLGSQAISVGQEVLAEVFEGLRTRIAPVNAAVDIRTDKEDDEGMADKLSDNAKSALIAPRGAAKPVLAELRKAGLIGDRGGLTEKGFLARQKAVQAAEDKAFG